VLGADPNMFDFLLLRARMAPRHSGTPWYTLVQPGARRPLDGFFERIDGDPVLRAQAA
jgi:hypothetical protein